ncbi:hypothetical protein ES703_80915 [subsurface metagenome]
MGNKLIREKILTSPSLARCSWVANLAWPWILFCGDDWGCFEAVPDTVRSRAFPKRKDITDEMVASWLDEYEREGQLFRWHEGERVFGYFITNSKHNAEYRSKWHKRKTNLPPETELRKYLQDHSIVFQDIQDGSIIFKDVPTTSKDFQDVPSPSKSRPTPTPTPTPTPKKKKDTPEAKDASGSVFDYRMTIRLRKHVESYKGTKPKTKAQLQKWANSFRLMRKEDKVDPRDIRRWLLWAIRDEFWRGNILSAGKFRLRIQEGKIQAAIAREVERRGASGGPSEAAQERDDVAAKRRRAEARKAQEEREATKREVERLAELRKTNPVKWAECVLAKKDIPEEELREMLKSRFILGFYREAIKILLEEIIKQREAKDGRAG